jgi:hypothetical protein
MLIFGHRFISSRSFYHIEDIDAIAHTPSNSLIYLVFSEKNLDIINHLKDNDINFALAVNTVRDLIYAENIGASFIVVESVLAKSAQKIAETYLFDAKILCRIREESQIEAMAFEGIDGVVFSDAIIKITS